MAGTPAVTAPYPAVTPRASSTMSRSSARCAPVRVRDQGDGADQAAGVGVAGRGDDGPDRPRLHDLAVVEHHHVVGDLGDDGEIVRDVDRRRPLPGDDLLEGFQHLDLGGHVQRGRRFVQHEQFWAGAQRHRHHQSLKLATGDLVGIAPTDRVRVGQFQRGVELARPRQCGRSISLPARTTDSTT